MTQSPNAQQIEYWNGPTGEKWAKLQERIDRNLANVTAALLPFAAPRAGERVLDIGCGCGTTTLMLREAVGPDGGAAGIDISRPMLDVARARAQAANADVAFVEADASTYEFQPVNDLVFSRFGVMFFADPIAAFANIRKALAPKGRFAFVCWRPLPENVWAAAPFAAARDLLPPQEPMDAHAPGPFALADGERTKSILSRAGFRDVALDRLDTTMSMGADLEEAAATALEIGPLARAAAELDEPSREKIRARVKTALAPYATPAGITPPAACWLVRASG
jgi:SAM-dependent methyltransferase